MMPLVWVTVTGCAMLGHTMQQSFPVGWYSQIREESDIRLTPSSLVSSSLTHSHSNDGWIQGSHSNYFNCIYTSCSFLSLFFPTHPSASTDLTERESTQNCRMILISVPCWTYFKVEQGRHFYHHSSQTTPATLISLMSKMNKHLVTIRCPDQKLGVMTFMWTFLKPGFSTGPMPPLLMLLRMFYSSASGLTRVTQFSTETTGWCFQESQLNEQPQYL